MSTEAPAAEPVTTAASKAKRAWFRLSLRLRLTLLTMAAFLVFQTVFSLGRSLLLERQIDTSLGDRLETQAKSLIAKLERSPYTPGSKEFFGLVESEPRSILVEELLVGLYTPRGDLLASNCDPPLNFFTSGGATAVLSDRPTHNRYDVPALRTPDGQWRPGRTVAVPWTAPTGEKRVLILATSDEFVVQLSNEISRNIWLSIPISLVPVAIAGWLIAGMAVRPILRLQQVAQVLNPDSLADQIDIGSTATEVQKLQDQLNHARDRLDAHYRAQEQFAANVAHEMKTPLAVIAARADNVLPRVLPDSEIAAFVDLTRGEALRLARTCDSLLLLTRVHHGKPIAAAAREYLVNEWIMDSVQDCASLAKQSSIAMAPQLLDGDHADACVMGDIDLLRITLDNILRNAVRFSPPGESVTLQATAEGDKVVIRVRDRGPGIPPHLLTRIFDRFVQAEPSVIPQGGRSAGIGLQIARGICELHHGTLTASNESESGCTLTITLPLQTDDAATET